METFKQEWFSHPEWWFNSSAYDEVITSRYQHLLDKYNSCDDIVTYILICDQLARHVYRNEVSSHIIYYFLQKALLKLEDLDIKQLSVKEFCFMMLPYRHSLNFDRISFVLKEAWKLLPNCDDNEDKSLLKRFIKATYERCPINIQHCLLHSYENTSCMNLCDYKNIFKFCPSSDPIPIKSDCKFKIVQDVRQFVKQFLEQQKTYTVVISLSGGVDSMVLSFIITQLVKKMAKPLTVVAFHMNYMNKEMCLEEEMFLITWCKYLNIPLYVRQIFEIKRQPCMENEMRDIYEAYTRNVRYSCYKSIINDNKGIVLLGHNKDDCFENILTNIIGLRNNGLRGMDTIVTQDSITFGRPFLNIPKKEIRAFAVQHNIPHLQDSTPSWSQRGKIRDIVVPSLNKWDSRFYDSMFELSKTLDAYYQHFDENVQSLNKQFVHKNDNEFFTIINIDILQSTPMFWTHLLHYLVDIHFSKKSIVNLCSRFNLYKSTFHTINNKSQIHVNMSKNVSITFQKVDHTQNMTSITIKKS